MLLEKLFYVGNAKEHHYHSAALRNKEREQKKKDRTNVQHLSSLKTRAILCVK